MYSIQQIKRVETPENDGLSDCLMAPIVTASYGRKYGKYENIHDALKGLEIMAKNASNTLLIQVPPIENNSFSYSVAKNETITFTIVEI